MKKYLNLSLIYAIAAMAGGVFYREFTKFQNFSGETMLSVVHTHLFLLGMFMFLIVALFSMKFDYKASKLFKCFMLTYNIGVLLTVIMLIVRGIMQVMGIIVSKGLNASISGIAGLGHILTGIGIIFLILALKKFSNEKS